MTYGAPSLPGTCATRVMSKRSLCGRTYSCPSTFSCWSSPVMRFMIFRGSTGTIQGGEFANNLVTGMKAKGLTFSGGCNVHHDLFYNNVAANYTGDSPPQN